jgi:hypothetical protein
MSRISDLHENDRELVSRLLTGEVGDRLRAEVLAEHEEKRRACAGELHRLTGERKQRLPRLQKEYVAAASAMVAAERAVVEARNKLRGAEGALVAVTGTLNDEESRLRVDAMRLAPDAAGEFIKELYAQLDNYRHSAHASPYVRIDGYRAPGPGVVVTNRLSIAEATAKVTRMIEEVAAIVLTDVSDAEVLRFIETKRQAIPALHSDVLDAAGKVVGQPSAEEVPA